MPEQPDHQLQIVLRDQGTPVWRLIVRILGNDGADAADCFQQSFFELAARHASTNDIRRAPALWSRIAAARAVDLIRRRIRDRARTQPVDDEEVVARPDVGPAAKAEEAELLADFRAALAALPEAQASAFLLTQIDEVSNQEAARMLGVSVNHLGVLLHRARAALSARLESHNPVQEQRP